MPRLRMTIGERLGLAPKVSKAPAPEVHHGPLESSGVPVEVEPEKVIRLAHAPSATTVMFESIPEPIDDGGPPRVTGHMEFIHKTAPILVIHGRDVISPEEYSSNRRR